MKAFGNISHQILRWYLHLCNIRYFILFIYFVGRRSININLTFIFYKFACVYNRVTGTYMMEVKWFTGYCFEKIKLFSQNE